MSVLNFPCTKPSCAGDELAHRLQQQLCSRFRGLRVQVMEDGVIRQAGQ